MDPIEKPSKPPTPFTIFSQLEKNFLLGIPKTESNQTRVTRLPQRYAGVDIPSDWCESPRKRQTRDQAEYPRISSAIAMRWEEVKETDLETRRFCEKVADEQLVKYHTNLIAYQTALIKEAGLIESSSGGTLNKTNQVHHARNNIIRDSPNRPKRKMMSNNEASVEPTTPIKRVVTEEHPIKNAPKMQDGVGADEMQRFLETIEFKEEDEPRTPQCNSKPSVVVMITPCSSLKCQGEEEIDFGSFPSSFQKSLKDTSPSFIDNEIPSGKYGLVEMSDDEIFDVWFKLFDQERESQSQSDHANNDESHSIERDSITEFSRPICFTGASP